MRRPCISGSDTARVRTYAERLLCLIRIVNIGKKRKSACRRHSVLWQLGRRKIIVSLSWVKESIEVDDIVNTRVRSI